MRSKAILNVALEVILILCEEVKLDWFGFLQFILILAQCVLYLSAYNFEIGQ